MNVVRATYRAASGFRRGAERGRRQCSDNGDRQRGHSNPNHPEHDPPTHGHQLTSIPSAFICGLTARVKLVVHRAQARIQDVRINLRRRQVGMAQHHLDRAQVGAALEQVRGKRMPQDVGTQ